MTRWNVKLAGRLLVDKMLPFIKKRKEQKKSTKQQLLQSEYRVQTPYKNKDVDDEMGGVASAGNIAAIGVHWLSLMMSEKRLCRWGGGG